MPVKPVDVSNYDRERNGRREHVREYTRKQDVNAQGVPPSMLALRRPSPLVGVGDRVRIVAINNPGVNPSRDAFIGQVGIVRKVIKSRNMARIDVPGLGTWDANPSNLEVVSGSSEDPSLVRFKQDVALLLEGSEEWVVIPEDQVRSMSTNDLYLAERGIFEGRRQPIETRTMINIQRELKRRGGI